MRERRTMASSASGVIRDRAKPATSPAMSAMPSKAEIYSDHQQLRDRPVRVRQHGACIAMQQRTTHGPVARRAYKVHAVVAANGMPTQLGLTPGEAHDNRLCPELLTRLQPVELLFYVVAGIGWILPAMPIISWMARPDA